MEVYTYDKDGNQLSATDGTGTKTRQTLDGDGNVLTEVVADLSGNILAGLENLYDGAGNLLTSEDGDGDGSQRAGGPHHHEDFTIAVGNLTSVTQIRTGGGSLTVTTAIGW